MKIVINQAYGGFRVSPEFCDYYNIPYEMRFEMCFAREHISRKDSRLISYIEERGSKAASDAHAYLKLINIPAGTAYRICNYDGYEYLEYRDEIEWEIAED